MEILVHPKNKLQADALKLIFTDMQLKFKEKKTASEKSKLKLQKDLKQAMKEVQLHQEGKLQLKTAKELLDEL